MSRCTVRESMYIIKRENLIRYISVLLYIVAVGTISCRSRDFVRIVQKTISVKICFEHEFHRISKRRFRAVLNFPDYPAIYLQFIRPGFPGCRILALNRFVSPFWFAVRRVRSHFIPDGRVRQRALPCRARSPVEIGPPVTCWLIDT